MRLRFRTVTESSHSEEEGPSVRRDLRPTPPRVFPSKPCVGTFSVIFELQPRTSENPWGKIKMIWDRWSGRTRGDRGRPHTSGIFWKRTVGRKVTTHKTKNSRLTPVGLWNKIWQSWRWFLGLKVPTKVGVQKVDSISYVIRKEPFEIFYDYGSGTDLVNVVLKIPTPDS